MHRETQQTLNIALPRRIAVIVYDALLLFAILFFTSIPVVTVFSITYDSPLYPLYLLYIYLVAFLYYGWFWTHGGQTLAMKTWKTRLFTPYGQVNWLQAGKRYLSASLVTAIPLLLLSKADHIIFHLLLIACLIGIYLISVFRDDRATWYDLFSDTYLRMANSK